MDAKLSAAGSTWNSRRDAIGLALRVLVALAVMLLLAGLLVAVRRLAGTASTPLSTPALLGWAIMLGAFKLAFRGACRPLLVGLSPLASCLLWAVPTAVALLWAAALCMSGTPSLGLVGFWGVLIAEEVWSWRRSPSLEAPRLDRLSAVLAPQVVVHPAASVLEPEDSDSLDGSITQQMVRRRNDDGGESIEGWLRVDFQPGQRHAYAHLAICPAFARAPQCFAESMDGPAAQVKVAQTLAAGVRLEIKLDRLATETCAVLVEFSLQEHCASGPG